MLVALVAIDSFAELLAGVCGVNVTLIVQDDPGFRLEGDLFVWTNKDAHAPVRRMAPMANGAEPLFVSVVVSGALRYVF